VQANVWKADGLPGFAVVLPPAPFGATRMIDVLRAPGLER
jgi:hypothetical protein